MRQNTISVKEKQELQVVLHGRFRYNYDVKIRSLNILQTCFSASWGGLEIQALESTLRMQQQGHTLWLACARGSKLGQEAAAQGVSVIPFSVRGYFHPSALWQLRAFLLSQQIDIIHCQHSRDIATVVPAMRLTGRLIPVVLSKRMGSYISKKDFLHRFTYAGVCKVLAISNVIRNNVIDTTPVYPEDVIVVHDAIDTDRFSPKASTRERIRKELGYRAEDVLIGFVGRFSPGKGQEDLLDALAILKPEHPSVRCLIVGEASRGEEAHEQRIRSQCTTLGLDAMVRFAGYRTDIPALLSAFDLFVFPSHAEAFGVALIEAMATGLPVISTNCDGVLDIVVHGESGIFVDPKNPRQIADALKKLMNNPELRNRLAHGARKRVVEFFDQNAQTRRIEEIYFGLLDRSTS